MVQSLRRIKDRIRSVENVKKVTHAMEMISVSKFKSTENKLISARNYFLNTERLLKNVLSSIENISHPLLEERESKKKIALCLITSDTGLCSLYNYNILRLAEDFINKRGKENIILVTAGKKGFNYFRKKDLFIPKAFTEFHSNYSDEAAGDILKSLTDLFLSRQADEVYAAYTYFESPSRRRPVIEKFLNIEHGYDGKIEYIFEPDANSILEELIPLYIFTRIKAILLNSFGSEHASRMIAMGEATENAKELIEGMILLRNKTRQAYITKEILELINSAEALKG